MKTLMILMAVALLSALVMTSPMLQAATPTVPTVAPAAPCACCTCDPCTCNLCTCCKCPKPCKCK